MPSCTAAIVPPAPFVAEFPLADRRMPSSPVAPLVVMLPELTIAFPAPLADTAMRADTIVPPDKTCKEFEPVNRRASTVDVTEPAAVTVFPLVRFSAGEPPELSTDAPGSTVSVSPVAAPALKPLASAPVQDTIPPLGAGSGRQAPRTGE